MKKIILLCIPLLLAGCGDGDGNSNNRNVDPNDPLIGEWKQISFEFYGTLLGGERTGRACIEEWDPNEGGTWEQVGAAGNYLITDPN
jgi:hypothetical protein